MNYINPINQTKLYGLANIFKRLVRLYEKDDLPNKILLSGQKGIGKSTLAYHFINYILSKNEEFNYDVENNEINIENRSYKLTLNKSNPNFFLIDIDDEKRSIGIDQIRNLISNLSKSSFNQKPRFILIDNIEYLNTNSINALLKTLEEPSSNVYFILINNNKKVLETLSSRCIKFNISLSNNQNLEIANNLLNGKLDEIINKDLINYYLTPGNIYNLILFAQKNNYDLLNLDLRNFLKILIKNNHYKKSEKIKYLIFEFIEYYFSKNDLKISKELFTQYNYFIKRISDTKRYNLDEDSLFLEFDERILNG